jgi:hypothetical protein
MQGVHVFSTYFYEINLKLNFVLLLGYAERTDYPFLAAGIQIIQNIILCPYIAYEPKA